MIKFATMKTAASIMIMITGALMALGILIFCIRKVRNDSGKE